LRVRFLILEDIIDPWFLEYSLLKDENHMFLPVSGSILDLNLFYLLLSRTVDEAYKGEDGVPFPHLIGLHMSGSRHPKPVFFG